MGLFLMESMRFTRLFPVISALPDNGGRHCLCTNPLGGQEPGIVLP